MIITFDPENMTQAQTAQVLGVSVTQVNNYLKNGSDFPYCTDTSGKGKPRRFYRLPDLLLWLIKYRGHVADEDLDALDRAKLLKLESEAARERLKLDLELGRVLPAEQIEAALAATFGAVATQIQNFGDTVGKLVHEGLTPEQRSELLQSKIDAIFARLSRIDFLLSVFPEDEQETEDE